MPLSFMLQVQLQIRMRLYSAYVAAESSYGKVQKYAKILHTSLRAARSAKIVDLGYVRLSKIEICFTRP